LETGFARKMEGKVKIILDEHEEENVS